MEDNQNDSRREFFKTTALVAGAVGAFAACSQPPVRDTSVGGWMATAERHRSASQFIANEVHSNVKGNSNDNASVQLEA